MDARAGVPTLPPPLPPERPPPQAVSRAKPEIVKQISPPRNLFSLCVLLRGAIANLVDDAAQKLWVRMNHVNVYQRENWVIVSAMRFVGCVFLVSLTE